MKLEPMYDRVVVEKIKKPDVSKGGVYQGMLKEKVHKAKVIAVGKGRINIDGALIPLILKEGDVVAIVDGIGAEMKIEGKEYLVIKEDSILAIIKEG